MEYSYLLGKSYKVEKSDKYTDYENFIMYLAPADESGYNVCPHASAGCKASCLNTSGRGRFTNVQKARLNRTLNYIKERKEFMGRLEKEIHKAAKKYPKLAIRLNGTSDLNWMAFIKRMHTLYPDIVWYDYTKNPKFALISRDLPYYNVTFSRSEDNNLECLDMLDSGVNVAVVFKKNLPKKYMGFDVIDGDSTDARFLDPKGVVVGLRAKGKAKYDKTGFVVNI
jgi:hypothetical protein